MSASGRIAQQDLLEAVLSWFAHAPALSAATTAFLRSAASTARRAQPCTTARPVSPLRVRAHFQTAATAGSTGPLADVVRQLATAEPTLPWLQNPNYTKAAMGQSFVDNYGYIELVGPQRAFHSTEVLIGFLQLGPRTHYPDHSHPAEEVYFVVSGRAQWRLGDDDWITRPPGAAIHHLPHIRHAMRTQDEPLLALYCWMGEIGIPAALTVKGAGGT